MAFEVKEYPPRTFSEKYQKLLAPRGILQPPQVVFKNKNLGENAEDTFRKAFKITRKKLAKLRSSCANCQAEGVAEEACPGCNAVRYCSKLCRQARILTHARVCFKLKLELIDQMVECLPNPVPLGREVLRGSGGSVQDWRDWYSRHTSLDKDIKAAAAVVAQWWPLTGLADPGEGGLVESLERVVSNVFSTVLSIGQCDTWLPGVAPDDRKQPLHIHLMGADLPEVQAVESGLIQVSSRILGHPLVLTLVAPDLIHHPQTFMWSPEAPHQVTPGIQAVAHAGLYHDYWQQYIAPKTVARPHVAIAIHPGVHTAEMLNLWQPTLDLLIQERIPLIMTTYNESEFNETMEVLEPLKMNVVLEDKNPLRSLLNKQTPYEPDYVWASNSYVIVMDNRTDAKKSSHPLANLSWPS